MIKLLLTFSLCYLTFFHGVNASGANVPVPDDTVGERVRPELAPLGTRFRAFTVFSGISLEAVRRENIYSQDENQVDDTVTIVKPKLALRSNWSRHAMLVSAEADVGRYVNNSAENYDDTRLSASGLITVSRNSGFRLSGRLASLHEDRFSADNRQGIAPTLYDQSAVSVGYQHERGRLTLQLDVAFTATDFDDVAGLAGTIDNDDRDRDRAEVNFQNSYNLTPEFQVFTRGTLTSVDYTEPSDQININRSSSGHEVAIGATFDPTPLTQLDAYVGYVVRDYDDQQLDDIESTVFGATLTWRVSGLTTVTAAASRNIEETALVGAAGAVATRVDVGVDHELLRNLLLHASVYKRETEFSGLERKDSDRGTRLAARYFMNRRFTIELEYDSQERDFRFLQTPQNGFDTGNFALRITGTH